MPTFVKAHVRRGRPVKGYSRSAIVRTRAIGTLMTRIAPQGVSRGQIHTGRTKKNGGNRSNLITHAYMKQANVLAKKRETGRKIFGRGKKTARYIPSLKRIGNFSSTYVK